MPDGGKQRNYISYTDVASIDNLSELLSYIRMGYPPKILQLHFPQYTPKLMSTYWRQIHGEPAAAGGIPTASSLLARRCDRRRASVFACVYLSLSPEPWNWHDAQCLSHIATAAEVAALHGIVIPPVRAWALARALAGGNIHLGVCRRCKLMYAHGAPAIDRSCPHCADMSAGKLRSLVKTFSARSERVMNAINEVIDQVSPHGLKASRIHLND